MAYQIVCIVPDYCRYTDAWRGERVASRSHAYETEACARKFAGRLAEEDERCGGDASYRVIPFDGDPWARYASPLLGRPFTEPVEIDDYIPF